MAERRDYLTQAGVTWDAVSFPVASSITPVVALDVSHDDFIIVEVTNEDAAQSVQCAALVTSSLQNGGAGVQSPEQGLDMIGPGETKDARYDVRGKRNFLFSAVANGAGFSPVITIRRIQSWLP